MLSESAERICFSFYLLFSFEGCVLCLTFFFATTALGVASLTPGQKVWLGGLAVRMVEFSHDQKDVLNALTSCESYSTIPPVPKCTVKKPLSLSSVTLKEHDSALFCMKSKEIVKNMTPLHHIPERDAVWSSFRGQSAFFPGVSWLRWYLGDGIGFYFAWLRSYCFSLVFPSSVGLLTWLVVSTVDAIYSDQTTELLTMSIFRVCYGLVMVIWALTCNKIWRRQQSQLAEDWMSPVFANAADMSGWVSSHMEQLRPAFRGTLRESPIKGEMELHFSASERRILYLLSASVTFCCVLVALFINVLLLNLEVCLVFCYALFRKINSRQRHTRRLALSSLKKGVYFIWHLFISHHQTWYSTLLLYFLF